MYLHGLYCDGGVTKTVKTFSMIRWTTEVDDHEVGQGEGADSKWAAALGPGQKCPWKVMREVGKLMKSGSLESRSG